MQGVLARAYGAVFWANYRRGRKVLQLYSVLNPPQSNLYNCVKPDRDNGLVVGIFHRCCSFLQRTN